VLEIICVCLGTEVPRHRDGVVLLISLSFERAWCVSVRA